MDVFFAIVGCYCIIGVGFAVAFVGWGVKAIDPTARSGATWGFRVLIFPGTVAFWPLLAKRWAQGVSVPPEEKSPHRCAACGGCAKGGGT